jgi:hypothetical protein
MALCIMTPYHYGECHALFIVMLKLIILSAIILSIVVLNVVMLSVVKIVPKTDDKMNYYLQESIYEGKAQYNWPPCPSKFRSAPFNNKNIIYLFY